MSETTCAVQITTLYTPSEDNNKVYSGSQILQISNSNFERDLIQFISIKDSF